MKNIKAPVFGIIGMGRFGRLWAKQLASYGKIVFYDKNHQKNMLKEVSRADIVFLSIPISEIKKTCLHIKKYLHPNSLLVDCCSVKVSPIKMMQETFSRSQAIIGTHPLFGPDSVKKTNHSLRGHKIVVCPVQHYRSHPMYRFYLRLLKKLGLKIILTAPKMHDKQMAHSQGLVHFIGRGLMALHLTPQSLATPDYQSLCRINNMVCHDSWQLFWDMHRYNPETHKIRKKFIEKLEALDQKILAYSENDKKLSSLKNLRKKIEQTDKTIIKALAERKKLVIDVGNLKKAQHRQIQDTDREKKLMHYYALLSEKYQLDTIWIQKLFKNIIAHSRNIQKSC